MEAPSPPVSPWQLLYGGAHRLRQRWYRRRARRLPRPVVSIGNLCWGGGGKTPLTAAVAAHLRDDGLAVCILTRGYRGRGRGVRILSKGKGALFGPFEAGDEPVMLAGELPGVAVVVGADRHQAGLVALRELPEPPDLFLLDDGFSHLALERDLDVVVLPAADPFAGGRLPPSGRLREPLSAIARPRDFARAAESLGYVVAGELRFADHHPYPPATLARIEAAFAQSGARSVLTTAKDAVKLHGRLSVPIAVLPLHADPERAFWTWLDHLRGRWERGKGGEG